MIENGGVDQQNFPCRYCFCPVDCQGRATLVEIPNPAKNKEGVSLHLAE